MKKTFIIYNDIRFDDVELLEIVKQNKGSFVDASIKNSNGSDYKDPSSRIARCLYGEIPARYISKIYSFLKPYELEIRDTVSLPKRPWHSPTGTIVMHSDGAFFKAHRDCMPGIFETRLATFVYYFFKEPKPFEGGELVFYANGTEEIYTPQNGDLIVFNPKTIHEVRPVKVASGQEEDSRFAITGWIRSKNTISIRARSFALRELHKRTPRQIKRIVRALKNLKKNKFRLGLGR